ncbi:zinc ribbon domain-containing protein [Pigmentiphaga aceris]|uniref:Zinc ribbon domain-containing protein n=1 Tax=Pigmentiphaga aceris TaxID=1940612 RepID=A0A5C0B1M6_9BURK|nr:FmdB family zinc ribbon protein [Pigmentiphaga aceris]QEI08482.1 zinc ribbon domain-containing protein [Pigmentiphaga aceris]
MPIYAYKCSECGFQKDALQKMSDPKLTHCPSCNQETLVKQVTAAGFQLKGSGWYVTDFRGGSGKTSEAATGPSSDAAPAPAPAAAPAPAPAPAPAAAKPSAS